MKIIAENLGKKFRNEWIFRNFNQSFSAGNSYAIIGSNGSGKSTLIQVLSSYIPNNEGIVKYFDHDNKVIEIDKIFKYLSITSPLLELVEDFTLLESLKFHIKLKPFSDELTIQNFIQLIDFEKHKDKQIKFFSSGMKQKLKLALCLFSNSPILLLDEPTTNLDEKTKNWFIDNITKIKQNKLIILASNEPKEYVFADEIIDIQTFK